MITVCFGIPLLCLVIPLAVMSIVTVPRYLKFLWHDAPEAFLRWTETQGFSSVAYERRTFFTGPFFLSNSSNQAVYRISVRDKSGPLTRGWVRIGGYWWPCASRLEVRWDDRSPGSAVFFEKDPFAKPPLWDRELDR